MVRTLDCDNGPILCQYTGPVVARVGYSPLRPALQEIQVSLPY